jgi:glycosyltransferase involved in cell wall biosynthesis
MSQTYTDWQLIVIDDGSHDDSAAIAASTADLDPRIRVLSQPNGGIAAARNRGIAEVGNTCDYIAFLDHDDIWHPEALARLVEAADAAPNMLGAHGRVGYIDADDHDISHMYSEPRHHRRPVLRDRLLSYLRDEEPTGLSTLAVFCCITTVGQVLLRREAVERVGAFDPDMVPSDDYDYWIRLSMIGDIAFVNHEVIKWRRHQGNTSGDDTRMIQALARIRGKWLSRDDLPEATRRLLGDGAIAAEEISLSLRKQWAVNELRRFNLLGAAQQYRHYIKGRAKIQQMRRRLQVPA